MTIDEFKNSLPDMSDEAMSRQVAHNLRTIRKNRGFTLELLSEQTGLSVSYISRLEAGSRRMNLDILTSVSKVLQCEISDILYGNTSHIVSFQDLGRQYSSVLTGKEVSYKPALDTFGPRKNKKILETAASNSFRASIKDLPLYGAKVPTPGQKAEEGIFDFSQPREMILRGTELADVKDGFALQVPDNSLMPKYGAGDILFIHPTKTPMYKTPIIIILENDHIISGLFQDWIDGGVSIFNFKGTELVSKTILSVDMKSMHRVVSVTYS